MWWRGPCLSCYEKSLCVRTISETCVSFGILSDFGADFSHGCGSGILRGPRWKDDDLQHLKICRFISILNHTDVTNRPRNQVICGIGRAPLDSFLCHVHVCTSSRYHRSLADNYVIGSFVRKFEILLVFKCTYYSTSLEISWALHL